MNSEDLLKGYGPRDTLSWNQLDLKVHVSNLKQFNGTSFSNWEFKMKILDQF